MPYEAVESSFTILDGICILIMCIIPFWAMFDFIMYGSEEIETERKRREEARQNYLKEQAEASRKRQEEHDRKLLEQCNGDMEEFKHRKRMEEIERMIAAKEKRGGWSKWNF